MIVPTLRSKLAAFTSCVGPVQLRNYVASVATTGQVVDKKSVRIQCEQGKTYSWCACGLSQKQPFCDGTHKKTECGLKPVRWVAPESKEYSFCNCKQTKKAPLCDGTHKTL